MNERKLCKASSGDFRRTAALLGSTMKHGILSLLFIALALTAASAANAGVRVVINPFGFVAPVPPVVYQPYPFYAAPPVVYVGGGSWGGDRRGRLRGHGRRR
jgi:hypothetical protein